VHTLLVGVVSTAVKTARTYQSKRPEWCRGDSHESFNTALQSKQLFN